MRHWRLRFRDNLAKISLKEKRYEVIRNRNWSNAFSLLDGNRACCPNRASLPGGSGHPMGDRCEANASRRVKEAARRRQNVDHRRALAAAIRERILPGRDQYSAGRA